MKKAVRCLCLLAVAVICESFTISEEEFEKLQLEEPEGCEISESVDFGYKHSMTCRGFTMDMTTDNITSSNPSLLGEELRSVGKCSYNSPPYKYLRLANSKRNSLTLENCPPPEHGSFGEGWPNLKIFKFENYGNIEPLTRQHFSGMNNVSTLILFTKSDHHMADDTLSDLTNVTEIHMSLKHTNKKIFKNLTKLEWLHITIDSQEILDSFDTSEMKHLQTFKTLEVTSTSFTRLTKRFFEGCPYVETLIIKFNTIDGIDADAFEPLTSLKHVSMLYNDLTSLPAGLLSKNTKLETFYFSSSVTSAPITSLPSGFFSYLRNLREITVNSNLRSIPADLIRGSTNLELLNLEFNRIFSIPRNLLRNHSKLKKIELCGNRLEDGESTDLFRNKSPLTEIHFCESLEQ